MVSRLTCHGAISDILVSYYPIRDIIVGFDRSRKQVGTGGTGSAREPHWGPCVKRGFRASRAWCATKETDIIVVSQLTPYTFVGYGRITPRRLIRVAPVT